MSASNVVARVAIVMGSDSDWPKIQAAAAALDEFAVPYEVRVMSATAPRTWCRNSPRRPSAGA